MPSRANARKKLSSQASNLLAQLARKQAGPRRCIQPVGIIGPGDGSGRECLGAYEVASALAKAGISIICGGRGGVMEAASRGASIAGGVAVGILPEEDLSGANRYLTIGIPTGMGEMRNAVIARSSVCLIAIGGGMGTISEIALGLKWGKPIFALYQDVKIPGTKFARGVDQLLEWAAGWLIEKQ